MEQALALFRQSNQHWMLAGVLWSLGYVHLMQGQLAASRRALEESLQVYRDIHDRTWIAIVGTELGRVAYLQGDHEMARAYLQDSLALLPSQGAFPVPMCLERLAAVAGAQNQMERAAALLGAADALRTEMDSPATPVDCEGFEPVLAAARAHLGEAGFTAAWAAGQAMTLESAVAYALPRPVDEKQHRA